MNVSELLHFYFWMNYLFKYLKNVTEPSSGGMHHQHLAYFGIFSILVNLPGITVGCAPIFIYIETLIRTINQSSWTV